MAFACFHADIVLKASRVLSERPRRFETNPHSEFALYFVTSLFQRPFPYAVVERLLSCLVITALIFVFWRTSSSKQYEWIGNIHLMKLTMSLNSMRSYLNSFSSKTRIHPLVVFSSRFNRKCRNLLHGPFRSIPCLLSTRRFPS